MILRQQCGNAFSVFAAARGLAYQPTQMHKSFLKNQDKPLRYYDDDNKQAFINSCQNRQLAKDLLAAKINGVTTGESTLSSSGYELNGVVVQRRIELDENNGNRAIVEYQAQRNNKPIAYRKAILIPNAVHWCG